MRFYVVDDMVLIREGLKHVLKEIPGAELCGESDSLEKISEALLHYKADILLLDMNLCEVPLKSFIQQLKATVPAIKVVVWSACACELPILAAIHSGIHGYIQKKKLSRDELLNAMRSLLQGKEYFSQEILRILVGNYSNEGIHRFRFSQREQEILPYLTSGKTNEQIAQVLFLSENTVATHRRNIMRKIGVNKTTELILWAREHNFQVQP
ncbi:MAG: response regulator transcription factor [Cytophagaceae bacterium]|jgi:DNA-binding NarL/FixJ family response regulator|nr:response regulator transcription factor [Cytophagaceae bacterium]